MTSSPGRRDMRRHDRRQAELPVTVRAAGRTEAARHTGAKEVHAGIQLNAADLSEGGAFLRSDLLFEVGEELDLEIPLPSGQVVKASGKVVRVSRRRGRESQAGMGIEFTKLSQQDRRSLAASLEALAAGQTG